MTTKNPSGKLVIKPALFRTGEPKLGVTKNWLTNNHWIVHKGLLADPLDWLSMETARAWLDLHMKSTKHLQEELNMNDEALTALLHRWKTDGHIGPLPRPLNSTYRHISGVRVKAYPMKGTKKLLCTQIMYYKMLEPFLTHLLHHNAAPIEAADPYDWESTSLCNHNATFVLRPYRAVERHRLRRV